MNERAGPRRDRGLLERITSGKLEDARPRVLLITIRGMNGYVNVDVWDNGGYKTTA